jgi:hypothetical protein
MSDSRKTSVWTAGLLAVACAATSPDLAHAQTILSDTAQNWTRSLLLDELTAAERADPDTVRQTSTPRLRLFGMPAGFLATPMGLEDEDEARLANDPDYAALFKKDDDFKNVQIALGMDNPFFDPGRPGGIGGVGYYQVYSQVQMFDTGATSMCLNLQALAPAGVQWGGLSNGPTFICPAMSIFHDLGSGTALQGFVRENLNAGPGWDTAWNRKVYYGMAWQCPLSKPEDGVYFFLQTLGHFNSEAARPTAHPDVSLLPGIQWRMADNFWLSLGGTRHGLVSCSLQF